MSIDRDPYAYIIDLEDIIIGHGVPTDEIKDAFESDETIKK